MRGDPRGLVVGVSLASLFMRQTQERGVSELIKMLEPLRERAAAQVVVLAEDDYERRWVAPRRAKREAETAQ
jgi:hypothetical protein